MKLFVSLILLFSIATHVRANCRGKRDVEEEMTTCDVINDDGSTTSTPYNICEEICCGGVLSDMDSGVMCCGNAGNSQAYGESQLCCVYHNEYQLHDKIESNDYCCGLDIFSPSLAARGDSCCVSKENEQQRFNTFTEMCCDGVVDHVGDTAFGSCCGEDAYDRRVASCPCLVAPPIYGADINAGCCRTEDGSPRENYDQDTQGCCDGAAYNFDDQFCCGGEIGNESHGDFCCEDEIGDMDSQYCCKGQLTDKPEGFGSGELSCCELEGGDVVAFDPIGQICCANQVQALEKDEEAVCCGDEIFYVSVTDTSFCFDDESGQCTPYDSETEVCCDGNPGPGEACCEDTPFYPASEICCLGVVGGHDFKWPSCCDDQPFDAYTQTCCGTVVGDNPLVTGPDGALEASHTTRCCGDFSEPDGLAPYDYLNGLCCGGVVHEIDHNDFGSAECCGENSLDGEAEICCDHQILSREHGDDTGCCGGKVFDQSSSICCDDVIQSLGGVSRERAICCGDGCIDNADYYCCQGRPYPKDDVTEEDFDNMSCDFGAKLE